MNSPVNSIVGDIGFIDQVGRPPGPDDDELVRLRAHISWVVAHLRRNSPSLTPQQRARRQRCLTLLTQYGHAGEFPRNTYCSGRRPVFVDGEGRVCAVGHLVAQTVGPDVTHALARDHRLSFIEEIDARELRDWADGHGFTMRELATIQPQYGGNPAQLTGWHWLLALGILPALTLLVGLARKHDWTAWPVRALMLLTACWGVTTFATAYRLHHSAALDWLVANFALSSLFITIGVLGAFFRSAIRRKALTALFAVLLTTTVVALVSVAPFAPRKCEKEGWTWSTRLGLWLSVVSPAPDPRPKGTWQNPRHGTGYGDALACPPVF